MKFWSIDEKLTWDDFKGEVNKDSVDIIALSGTGFVKIAIYDLDSSIIGYTLHAIFYREYSWVKEEGRTNYTLNHEQRHFDLASIFAIERSRKLQFCKNVANAVSRG